MGEGFPAWEFADKNIYQSLPSSSRLLYGIGKSYCEINFESQKSARYIPWQHQHIHVYNAGHCAVCMKKKRNQISVQDYKNCVSFTPKRVVAP